MPSPYLRSLLVYYLTLVPHTPLYHIVLLNKPPELLEFEFSLTTHFSDCMMAHYTFKRCEVVVENRTLATDLVLPDIQDFDVILAMD